ncbi:MAG TPA: DUF3016 domain-containing protein [Janthinobacterium sp.]|jgi:hypothetical protein|nr:DUF3016 domain-containing protein [Janthinobacterium sp.]
MRIFSRAFAAAALSLLASGAAWAGVSVTYVKPEEFRDVPFSEVDRERVLKQLTDHFIELGKSLPAGQDLKIEVTDLDLAGRSIPSRRGGDDLRILRGGADWPAMNLRYTLESQGQIVSKGEEQLSDMNYLNHMNRYSSGENLRFEKQMIDVWFKKKFLPAAKQG